MKSALDGIHLDSPSGVTIWENAYKEMDPWAQHNFIKAYFLTGYEGAFTAREYGELAEDEQMFFMTFLTEWQKHKREEIKK